MRAGNTEAALSAVHIQFAIARVKAGRRCARMYQTSTPVCGSLTVSLRAFLSKRALAAESSTS